MADTPDVFDQAASQAQPPPQAPPAQAPPQAGDLFDQAAAQSKGGSSGSVSDATKSWWDLLKDKLNEGIVSKIPTAMMGPVGAIASIARPPGETVGQTANVVDGLMDKVVQHEISSAHPWRAQIAQWYKGAMEDAAKFGNQMTAPTQVALTAASSGGNLAVKTGAIAANLYFAYKGGHELIADRQENETAADEIERRAMGGAGLLFSVAGAADQGAAAKEMVRQRIQNKLGISGDLAGKVTAKVMQIDQVRKQGAQEAAGETLKAVQQSGDIMDQAAAELGQPSVEPAVDSAARAAGVMPEGELGDFYRFRDPVTGGSLSIRKSQLSPDNLKAKASDLRRDVGPPKPDEDPIITQKRTEVQQRVQQYLASPPKGTGAAGSLEDAQKQIPIRMGQIVRDATNAVYMENARVSKPFEEMAAQAKTPVSDSQSVRATIVDTIKAHGVQDQEIPPRVFAALFKQGKGSNEWMDIPKGPIADTIPDFQEGLQEVNRPVSFQDITRVRGDLFDAAQSATDPVVKNGLFDAYDSVTKMQEKYADMNNFGDKYRAAKQDYKNFKRELGSGLMSDFTKAEDFRQQAMTPKLAKIMTGRDMEAMRGLLKLAGVDVGPLDELIAQRNAASKRIGAGDKEATKAATSVMKTGAKASAAKTAATEKQAAALGKQASVVPGVSDLTLQGKTTEQIRREALDRIATNTRQTGISNPMGMFMLLYGTLRLSMGSPFGAYPAVRGGATVLKSKGAQLLRNPSYQDWVIRESGVDPSNAQLIGKMRAGLAALAKTATDFVKNPPQPDEEYKPARGNL